MIFIKLSSVIVQDKNECNSKGGKIISNCDTDFGKCLNKDGGFSCKCNFGTMDIFGNGRLCSEQCVQLSAMDKFLNVTKFKDILINQSLGPSPCVTENTRKCVVTASIGQPICDCNEGGTGRFCEIFEGEKTALNFVSEASFKSTDTSMITEEIGEEDSYDSDTSPNSETSKSDIEEEKSSDDQPAFITLIIISIVLFILIGFVLAKSNILEFKVNV